MLKHSDSPANQTHVMRSVIMWKLILQNIFTILYTPEEVQLSE